jgi:hypothetical protein
MIRTGLGLADDFANGIIAKRIIELARTGERHPDLLCEGALKALPGICSRTADILAIRVPSSTLSLSMSGWPVIAAEPDCMLMEINSR